MLAIAAIFTCCFFGLAVAAETEENADGFMQIHKIEIAFHQAGTTKNLDLMLSLFTDAQR